MKVEIFIFRHGETDWNREERFQGHLDIPLNETGKIQAKQLIPILKKNAIEVILSSDLMRALQTAQIVADELGISVHSHAGLREAHLGKAQGLTRREIESLFGEELVTRWKSSKLTDADISYPDGETGKQIMERVFSTLEKFLQDYPTYQRIGVASHGGVIRRIMQKLLPPHSPPIPIPNGVIYRLTYDKKTRKFFTEIL
jgi:2,3-bisphosphoglycerate-dependent phosphoglycerate mutase